MTIRESELHVLGKTVFDDAVGQEICLPAPVSPLFTPPLKHRVKKVEFEKGLPFAGHNGRRADVILTSVEGVRIIVEVKYSHGKGMDYGFDMARAGNWLAVELDVARWKEDATLLPDFSRPGMLQRVLNQVTWLNPGEPSSMEWLQYSEVWHKYERDVAWDRDEESRAERRAEYARYGLWFSTLTVHRGWYLEHGWELHRDGGGLREYRIRQPGDCTPGVTEGLHHGPHPDVGAFQAFDAIGAGHFFPTYSKRVPGRQLEGREQEDVWAGPVRALWKDAVKDLFGYRAPGAHPIF